MNSRTTRELLAVVLVMLVAVGVAAPAAAHSKLVSTSPIDGAVLAKAPDTVSFTFDEDLLPGVNTIAITGADGNVITSSKAEPDGNVITAPWPPDLPDGTYQIAYRIVSHDGHPVSGAILVTLEGNAGGAPGAASSTISAGPITSMPAVSASVEPLATPTHGSLSFGVWALIGAVAIALSGIGAAIVARRGTGAAGT